MIYFHYIRISPDTPSKKVFDLMLEVWALTAPQLLISVTGGAKRFDLKPRLANRFKRGLMKAATSTGNLCSYNLMILFTLLS